jgi:hypothetical protein
MALQKNIELNTGIKVNDAYLRIDSVTINQKQNINFFLKSYISNDVDLAFDVKEFSCSYDINGENPIKQAYLHLKTLPEFVDATDC